MISMLKRELKTYRRHFKYVILFDIKQHILYLVINLTAIKIE